MAEFKKSFDGATSSTHHRKTTSVTAGCEILCTASRNATREDKVSCGFVLFSRDRQTSKFATKSFRNM